MQLFVIDSQAEGIAFLRGEEAHHCQRVLRQGPGDIIQGVDGKGQFFRGPIVSITEQEVQFRIEETHSEWGEHPFRVCLVVSPLRLRDRFEWMIEKSVELGVTDIYPARCERTVHQKARIKENRLQHIMISAMKQCLRSRLPRLHPLQELKDILEKRDFPKPLFIARADASEVFSDKINPWPGSATLLIGPEGDFSDRELTLAQNAGAQPVNLGNTRLRTETAAIYGLSIIKSIAGY